MNNTQVVQLILQLVIWLVTNFPGMAAAVQEIIDHTAPWTPEEAAAFRARMEARLASPDWEVTP